MSLVKRLVGKHASPGRALRTAGDAARDAKDWPAAVEAYRAYLDERPDDAGIWVQHAHVLKEQGLLAEAEASYRKATAILPAGTDARLHLAHLLKQMDLPVQAAALFREVQQLAPTPEAALELHSLEHGPAGHGQIGHVQIGHGLAEPAPDAQAILGSAPVQAATVGRYIELKDLFQYLTQHTTVTGITRVTLGLVQHVIEGMEQAEAATYHFVHQYGDAEGVVLIPKEQMRRVVQMAMGNAPDLAAMQALIADVRATATPVLLERGHLYLIPGAFWEFVGNPSWLGSLKGRGVLIGAYIYDLIPITHAHYCMVSLTDTFTCAFAEVARVLDFALTISEFVAGQVTDWVAQHGIAPFPIIAVPLAHELRFASERAKPRYAPSAKLDELDGTPFVLCVCTIEARKNHVYLFYVWQRMIEAGLDVPDLVFVGRPGWRIQDLMEQIEASRHLGGRLHVLYGLTDDDLGALYDRCLFTVFPSFVEGWGLPVGESLARGKVCVASSTSSIPEVGGKYAIYVDPFNLDSGYQAISALVSDPSALARREQDLRSSFIARTWEDVGRDFFARLDDAAAASLRTPRTQYAPALRPGEVADVAQMSNVGALGAEYVANPFRLLFAEGWRSVEVAGTWMLAGNAKLRVQTGCRPGQVLSVLLHVGTSPWVTDRNVLRVSAAGPFSRRRGQDKLHHARTLRPNASSWIRVKGEADAEGLLTVHIRVEGGVTVEDPSLMPVAIRLHGFGYAPADDLPARLALLEEALVKG